MANRKSHIGIITQYYTAFGEYRSAIAKCDSAPLMGFVVLTIYDK